MSPCNGVSAPHNESDLTASAWACTLWGASWLLAAPLWAQSAAATDLPVGADASNGETVIVAPAPHYRQFDRVEITGSSIVRKEQTQTLPVQVITRSDIQKSGKPTVAELIQVLPLMSGFTSPVDIGYLAGGSNAAAIHGMQSGTVVLINGRRIAPQGIQSITAVQSSGTELNLLPISAIDRIEILTDGASSIYGADAVAGVVNIITRSERAGVEITAEQRFPDKGKGQMARVDLSVGEGRLDRDGYSWFVAADASQQAALLGADRAYAAQGRYAVAQDGKNYWAYDPQLMLAQTGTTLTDTARGTPTKSWSAQYQNGQCANANVPVYGQQGCYYGPLLQTDLMPKVDAMRLHGQGQWMVDANTTAFVELGLQSSQQARLTRPWAPYTAQIANRAGAPGYDLALAQGFDPAKGVWLRYSGSELGLLPRQIDMQSLRMSTGLKGRWDDWDYRSALYYSDNRMQYGSGRFTAYPNLGVDAQGFLNTPALLAPLEPGISSDLLAKLQGMPYWNDTSAGVASLQGLELSASRPLGEIAGRDVFLALGTDLRQAKEKFDTFNPPLTQPSYSGQRLLWAQFAEMQVPLSSTLETIVSWRHDHYSDFGNTSNGKWSAKWAPAEQWLLRGAIGTGFRAPAIAQYQPTADRSVGGAMASTCTADLLTLAQRLGGSCPVDNSYTLTTQGNPHLKPERSRHFNVGIRFSPSRNQSFWADYWRVDMRDKIGQLAYSRILQAPLLYPQHFELDPQGQLRINSPLINAGATQKSGVDFGWSLRHPGEWGVWLAQISGTWLTKSRYKETDDSEWTSELNKYSSYSGFVVPRLQMQMTLGLSQAQWQTMATVRYIGAYDDGGFSGINADTGEGVQIDHHQVPAFWTLDVAASYEVSRQLKVRVGLENIFNRASPLSFGGPGGWNYAANPMYASLYGRTFTLAANYRF